MRKPNLRVISVKKKQVATLTKRKRSMSSSGLCPNCRGEGRHQPGPWPQSTRCCSCCCTSSHPTNNGSSSSTSVDRASHMRGPSLWPARRREACPVGEQCKNREDGEHGPSLGVEFVLLRATASWHREIRGRPRRQGQGNLILAPATHLLHAKGRNAAERHPRRCHGAAMPSQGGSCRCLGEKSCGNLRRGQDNHRDSRESAGMGHFRFLLNALWRSLSCTGDGGSTVPEGFICGSSYEFCPPLPPCSPL